MKQFSVTLYGEDSEVLAQGVEVPQGGDASNQGHEHQRNDDHFKGGDEDCSDHVKHAEDQVVVYPADL